jgi:Carboxypeptidase regulatory-like domain/TonB dependent receptor
MKSHLRSSLKAALAMLLAVGLTAPAFAQSVTATITGTVQDKSGAVLKDANITAVNTKTQVEYPTKSNSSGVYTIQGLPIGVYTIKADAPGMKSLQTNPITLEVGQTARVNLPLEVGAKTEEIEVVGVNPVLQTENATVGETITGSTASALPLNGRNFAQLTLLVPGAITTDPQSFSKPGGNQTDQTGGRPYINGQRQQSNNFMLDGLDMNEALNNLVAYSPSPDALAEIKVDTNNYSAEFGNTAGGIINTVMKTGTNDFHGGAFEYHRGDALDANGWVLNQAGGTKAKLTQDIFGGFLGGPLVKDKLFFFADYQGVNNDQPGASTATVAPASFRGGDFSSLSIPIIDPTTGKQFPGNIIPANRINPVAAALLGNTTNYPLPTTGGLSNNFSGNQDSTVKNNQGDVKLDANLGPKDNAFLRVSYAKGDGPTIQNLYPDALGHTHEQPSVSGAINWTHSFGATAVNELRVGYSQVKVNDLQADPFGLGNYNAAVGIPGTQTVPGLSAINFSTVFSSLGGAAADGLETDKVYQISDKYSFSAGKHYVSIGGQALHSWIQDSYASNNGNLGAFNFNGNYTGFAFADFLLGDVSSKNLGGSNAPWTQTQNKIGLFIQDDWKASSNLTVNLGLRWEVTTPQVEVNNLEVNYDPSTGTAIFPTSTFPASCSSYAPGCAVSTVGAGLYSTYYGGFEPRLGFAWTANEKTVVRGGFGIVQYMEGLGANRRLAANAPFQPPQLSQTYGATPGSISNGFADLGTPGGVAALGTGIASIYPTDLKPELTEQWNFFIERQLTASTSLNIGYVGNHSTHLIGLSDANQNARLSPAFAVGAVIPETIDNGTANYEGLQVSARHRLSHGIEFLASYTYSKSMTDNPGFFGAGWGGTTGFQQQLSGAGTGNTDFNNPSLDYGPSLFDARHVFNFATNIMLPFGHGRQHDMSGVGQVILGGWNLGGIFSARSGFPITVYTSAPGTPTNFYNVFGNNRPNLVGDPTANTNFSLNTIGSVYLNSAAFAQPALGSFGTATPGIATASGYWNLDLSLDKEFSLGGERALTVRIEAFNVLNHNNPGMPDNNWANGGNPNFGTVNYVNNAPRILELAGRLRF